MLLLQDFILNIKNSEPVPVGYICVEMETGACDGIYYEKSEAERMAGFNQALWTGSHWTLITAFKGDSVRGRFHMEDSIRKNLYNFYGAPNYKAADLYDRQYESA